MSSEALLRGFSYKMDVFCEGLSPRRVYKDTVATLMRVSTFSKNCCKTFCIIIHRAELHVDVMKS